MSSMTTRTSLTAAALLVASLTLVTACGSSSSSAGPKTTGSAAKNDSQAGTAFCKAVVDYQEAKTVNIDGSFDAVDAKAELGKTLAENAPEEIADDVAVLREYTDAVKANQGKPSALKKLQGKIQEPAFQKSFANVLTYINANCGVTLTLED